MASSLTDRLRGIVGGAVPRVSPDAWSPEPAPVVPAYTEGHAEGAADVLGGAVLPNNEGPVVVVDRHYAAADRHGRTLVGEIADTLLGLTDALQLLSRAWPGRGGNPSGLPGALWFLDLETTGLAGGAGTQAFLVGCASLDKNGIAVRQFLLPGFEHERALLSEVGAWASSRGAVVTFNGKSFDLPLIETRYLFHRVPFPMEGVAHFDMLHPARRLWRARAAVAGSVDASCSLGTLERALAGVHRVGDVPGFEIPSRYFQFVRDGDARPLEAVLEHNRLDLVSLALVTARALTLIDRGPDAATDAYECLGLARIYDRAGRSDDAEVSYLRAIERLERVGRDPDTCGDALRRLAWCRRRAGRLREAAEAWQRLADLPRCPAAFRREAREALAIHHEHRSRDLEAAHAHVQQLLDDDLNSRRRQAAEHRLRRLERKREREREAGAARLWA
jgi:tetratricopeptide (TPR) repeat protein